MLLDALEAEKENGGNRAMASLDQAEAIFVASCTDMLFFLSYCVCVFLLVSRWRWGPTCFYDFGPMPFWTVSREEVPYGY